MSTAEVHEAPAPPTSNLNGSVSERQVLDTADQYLRDGLALKSWYDKAFAAGRFEEMFALARTVNRPDVSFGFFDGLSLADRTMPVMGIYQEMFYDQPGAMTDYQSGRQREWLDQVREF